MLKLSVFTNFAYLGIFLLKKNRNKNQIYYILRYSVKIVLSTHTNSFPFTCPFYDMVSYICNPKSPLPNSLFKETQKSRKIECQLSKRSLKWIKRSHFAKHM